MNRFAPSTPLAAWLVAGLLIVAGCASSQPLPAAELGAARTAIASAEEAGASEHAPLELRTARQKLEQAQAASDRGDARQARILSEQAALDARLAEVTTRANRQQEAVDAVQATVRALREEIERNRRATGGQ